MARPSSASPCSPRAVAPGLSDAMPCRGFVKWFNTAKGFGFLGRADGPDVFVHYRVIETEGYKTLRDGDEVEFDIVESERGPQAAHVLLLRKGL